MNSLLVCLTLVAAEQSIDSHIHVIDKNTGEGASGVTVKVNGKYFAVSDENGYARNSVVFRRPAVFQVDVESSEYMLAKTDTYLDWQSEERVRDGFTIQVVRKQSHRVGYSPYYGSPSSSLSETRSMRGLHYVDATNSTCNAAAPSLGYGPTNWYAPARVHVYYGSSPYYACPQSCAPVLSSTPATLAYPPAPITTYYMGCPTVQPVLPPMVVCGQ